MSAAGAGAAFKEVIFIFMPNSQARYHNIITVAKGIKRNNDCGINIARKYIIPTEVRTLSSHPGAIDVENLLVVVIGRVGWKPHLGTEKRFGGLLNSKTSLLRPDNQAT